MKALLLLSAALAVGSRASDPGRLDLDVSFIVPPEIQSEVLDYLERRYKDPVLLRHFGEDCGHRVSVEDFTDVYFDTDALAVLATRGEIRHRRRYARGEKVKELIQIKLPGDQALEELKFEVRPRVASIPSGFGFERVLPLVSLPRRKDWFEVARTVEAKFSVPVDELRPIVTIQQTRHRVYITRPGGVLFTMTLDVVDARRLWATAAFTQLEIEANEIVYSNASSAERRRMAGLQQEIAVDLRARFPSLTPNHSAKYARVFGSLEPQIWRLRSFIRWGIL